MSTFEFNQQLMAQNLIDIDEIGQFALEASNDEGMYWYLVVKTSLGTTTIASCGPVVPDVNLLPNNYTCYLNRLEYKEKKIEKIISLWLNESSKKLTSAKIINIDDALAEFVDLAKYLKNYSDEIY